MMEAVVVSCKHACVEAFAWSVRLANWPLFLCKGAETQTSFSLSLKLTLKTFKIKREKRKEKYMNVYVVARVSSLQLYRLVVES
jgi:hypothetical protein